MWAVPNRAGTVQAVVEKEMALENLIAAAPGSLELTDDRPINEYYFLRRR